jgi:hypothetical protein
MKKEMKRSKPPGDVESKAEAEADAPTIGGVCW